MFHSFFNFLFKPAVLGSFLMLASTPLLSDENPNLINAMQAPAGVSPLDKALQVRVLALLETFSIQLHKIGVRVNSLKINQTRKQALKDEFANMQEKFRAFKAANTLHVDKPQLVKLLVLLHTLIKATEKALLKSFTIDIEPDPRYITRKQKNFTPQELDALLSANEKRLQEFDNHIANMNKTTVNRCYTWLSDRWNTPLYSFTALGGESNKDIYISSILKRFFSYGAGIGLVVYNLPKDRLESVSNSWLRDSLLGIKSWTGDSPLATTLSKATQANEVEQLATDGQHYFGSIENRRVLVSDEQGNPKITDTAGNQLAVVAGQQGYQFATEPAEGTTFNIHFGTPEASAQQQFTYTKENNPLDQILYNGGALNIPGVGFVREVAPGSNQFITLDNNHPITLTKEILETAQMVPFYTIKNTGFSVTDATGHDYPVSSDIVLNKDSAKFTTQTKSSHSCTEHGVEKSFLQKVIGNFNWITPLDLAFNGWQIPVAKMVSSQVTEDIETLKKDLPQIAAYWHNTLRGEEEELVGNYLVPKETFDDVVGREAIKKQFQPIIDFVCDPTSFIQAGIELPRGYLLAGEPQTGKTLMVKALGGELSKRIKETQGIGREVKVFPIEVHLLIKYGLRTYMDMLKDQAPCILFCDEFDLTGAQRSENKVFLAEALSALQGYATSSDLQELVLFIIATNRPENIDYAIRENGRCGTTLYFENPYYNERKDYFEHFFKTRVIDTKAFDLDRIAQETEACSYGTLKAIANGILSTADKYNKIPNQSHADEVLDTVVKKIISQADEIPTDKREIIAARYGAKAFASVILNPDKKFVAATLSKITEKIEEKPVLHHYDVVNDKEKTGVRFGGLFTYNLNDTYGLVSCKERIKECKIALAGTVGQRVLGLDYISYPEDEMEALKIARTITFNGCDERLYPRKVREEKGIEAYLLVEKCRQEMYDLLVEHKESYMKLANLLQRRKVIRTGDVKQCFGLDDLDLAHDYFGSTENSKPEETPKVISEEELFADNTDDEEIDALEKEEEEEQLREQAARRHEQELYELRQKELAVATQEEEDFA